MIQCDVCDREATHVLVNFYHTPIKIKGQHIPFCGIHAFEDGREKCPCCYDYWIEVGDDGVELLPTYSENTLDGEGCCSEHP